MNAAPRSYLFVSAHRPEHFAKALAAGADAVIIDLVVASRVAGIGRPVDGVSAMIDDQDSLAADVRRTRRLGFGGKLCIHPRQVATVNQGLSPSAAELAWADKVMAAAAQSAGAVVALDGTMIDKPVILRAEAMLAEARR